MLPVFAHYLKKPLKFELWAQAFGKGKIVCILQKFSRKFTKLNLVEPIPVAAFGH